MTYAKVLHQLILGIWIGAILFFGAIVAPALFQAFTPAQAGTVVRVLIPRLDGFALCAGPLLLVLAYLYEGMPQGRARIRAGLILGMTFFALLSAVWVTPRLSAIRAQANDRVSELRPEDPLRREFGKLHGVSTMLMLGELLLGIAASCFLLRRPDGTED